MSQSNIRSIRMMAAYGAVIAGFGACLGSLDFLTTIRSACWGAIFLACMEAYFGSEGPPEGEH